MRAGVAISQDEAPDHDIVPRLDEPACADVNGSQVIARHIIEFHQADSAGIVRPADNCSPSLIGSRIKYDGGYQVIRGREYPSLNFRSVIGVIAPVIIGSDQSSGSVYFQRGILQPA